MAAVGVDGSPHVTDRRGRRDTSGAGSAGDPVHTDDVGVPTDGERGTSLLTEGASVAVIKGVAGTARREIVAAAVAALSPSASPSTLWTSVRARAKPAVAWGSATITSCSTLKQLTPLDDDADNTGGGSVAADGAVGADNPGVEAGGCRRGDAR